MYWYLIIHILYISSYLQSLLFSSFCTLLPKPLEDSSKTVEGPPLPDHPDPLDPSQPPSLVPGEAVSWTRQKARRSTVVSRSWLIPHPLANRHPHPLLQWRRGLSGLQQGGSKPKPPAASTASSPDRLWQRRARWSLASRRINILT